MVLCMHIHSDNMAGISEGINPRKYSGPKKKIIYVAKEERIAILVLLYFLMKRFKHLFLSYGSHFSS